LTYHTRSQILQGSTSAISAGLLIYVACVELIAGDLVLNESLHRERPSIQAGAIVAFVAGALGMSLL
jgi:zinc transporter 1/2/3